MHATSRRWAVGIIMAAYVFTPISSPALCSTIQDAVKSGDVRLVDVLIRTSPELVHERDEDYATLLHLAVSLGHISVAELLLDHKANINARNSKGLTPLHLAAETGRTALASLLLARGADASAQDDHGSTPLLRAANAGNREMVNFFIVASLSSVGRKGVTPIQNPHGYDSIATILLKRRTNTPAPVNSGNEQPNHGSGAAQGIVLKEGTPVHLRVRQDLSTRRVNPGDVVELEVSEELIREGFPVIPRGSIATARVVRSEPSRMRGGGGSLDLEIIAVRDLLGGEVVLRGTTGARGSDKSFRDWNNSTDPIALLFSTPLYLLVKGQHAVLPRGVGVTAYVQGTYVYDPHRLEDRYRKLIAQQNQGWTGKARIHIYRIPVRDPQEYPIRKVRVLFDGGELVGLPTSRFLTLVVDRGIHSFQTRVSRVELELESGKEYYLRVDNKEILRQVEEDEGRYEIYTLKPLKPGDSRLPKRASGIVIFSSSDSRDFPEWSRPKRCRLCSSSSHSSTRDLAFINFENFAQTAGGHAPATRDQSTFGKAAAQCRWAEGLGIPVRRASEKRLV